MLKFLAYLALGKLIIYIAQAFPFQELIFFDKLMKPDRFLGKLWSCDLCLGIYLLSGLAYFLHVDILTSLGFSYVPFVSEVLTGMASSFVLHIFMIGLNAKFGVIVIGNHEDSSS
jgi:hypothetical protein